ncbi:MAG TPA: hypothetical protein VGW10_18110, partial [Solirubrobacteraceae bacterium]|nr:hypothetical protein [Solirubrobacteraceae bacterium]
MTRRVPVLAALAAAGAVGPAAGAEAAPLLTIGVEPTEATTSQATYELLAINHGDAPAEDVIVTTTVPQHATLVEADPAGAGACTAGAAASTACSWSLGSLPAGASRTITLVYALEEAATYTIDTTASVAAANAGSDSNSDSALTRGVYAASDDAWVDDAEPTGTNHGACDELRIGGTATSAFVESDDARNALFPAGSLVHVFAAELAAHVKAPAAGATLGAHRLLASGWNEGSGSCAGAAGANSEPRAGSEPTGAASATDTAPVPAAGERVRFDVRADVDTPEERRRHAGWELRAAGGGAGTPALHSGEGPAAQVPAVTLVFTAKPPSAACIDATAEDATAGSDQAQRIEARITDGGQRVSNGSAEACNGTPMAGREVHWALIDGAAGAPDGWFSNVDGVARPLELGAGGAAGPEAAATSSDAAGRSFVDVRLAQPYAEGKNAGPQRIDVNVAEYGTLDPDHPDCRPVDTCVAENTQEDDVRRTWTPVEAPPDDRDAAGDEPGPPPGPRAPAPPAPPPPALDG